VGSISTAGVYTAPALIAGPQTVTVSATSVADSSVAASATVALASPVSVALTPGSVTLTPSQTQTFTAAVTGTSNTAVTWSLSPAVGSISAAGLYTAPATVPYPNTVIITATSAANPTDSASGVVTIVPLVGTTYYLAPAAAGGNDSSNGLSPSAPWLTPNHAVNCGDVIIAAASASYSAANFSQGNWGTVTCATGNNVAWLKCATFDACKIGGLTSLQNGMEIHKSYWGVEGWEVDGNSASGICFFAGWANIHHIIFANDIAIGCGMSGLEAGNYLLAGPDYIAFVGNIAYGNSGGTETCGSGLDVYSPVAQDMLPGTHIYVAGNFSWKNVNANPCGGTTPTDGEGLIFDTFDGSQTPGLGAYTPQAVADNNILISNGGRGVEVVNNLVGDSNNSHIYVRHNTTWGNNTDLNQTSVCPCAVGEIVGVNFNNTEMYLNLAATNAPYGVVGYPIDDFWATTPTATDQINQNIGWSASGTYAAKFDPGSLFSYGTSNLFGMNPVFANPMVPGKPNCSGTNSVPSCVATLIANFTPTNSAATGYGYQIPGSGQTYDPLFPLWLCNVNLPPGLITMGCRNMP
jgi:hypothetical protein